MSSGLLTTARAIAASCVAAVCLAIRIEAAPQRETHATDDAMSRIKRELHRTTTDTLKLDPPLPVATFRVTVEKHPVMLSFQEQLEKEFALTDVQRQSQEWYAKCCGINLLNLPQWADKLDRARRRRELRRLSEQIARELAQIEANKRK